MLPIKRRAISNVLDNFLDHRNDMDGFFDDVCHFFGQPIFSSISSANYLPSVNMNESEIAYNLDVELPGMILENIDMFVSDNVLSIGGNRTEENEKNDNKTIYKEISYGQFRRDIPLSKNCDIENIKAQYKQGILKITIPKNPVEKPDKKKITITNED